MQLAQLLKRLDKERFASYPLKGEVSSLCAHSQAVEPGSLFVAIEGAKQKGSDFIAEAVRKGAIGVIAPQENESLVMGKVPFISFPDTRYALAVLADEFFGHPSGEIKVVGVTGTNGKTTITYIISHILAEANFSSGIIGTIKYSFKDTVIPASNTTPGPLELQPLLRQMVGQACDYCIMEVSSHGLDQKRAEGIEFKAGIFTNLTQDHLDYHLNLENYFLAKAKLFTSLKPDAYAIINADCPYGKRLIALTKAKVLTYAIDNDADIKAASVSLGLEGSTFVLHTKNGQAKITTPLMGRHNILNILAGIAFALTQGIGLSDIQKALASFPGVKGRLERLSLKGRNIFVDYAHTPDALLNALSILRQLSSNHLTIVFGCGGERDRLKRPLMAEVAQRYADTIIITSDNPRREDPKAIAHEIASGIKNKGYTIILDRRQAIEAAITQSKKGDTILIAGKGHENYQIFKDKKIEFDDIIVAQSCLTHIA